MNATPKTGKNSTMYRFAAITFALSGLVFCTLAVIRSKMVYGATGVSFLGIAVMYYYQSRCAPKAGCDSTPQDGA